MDRFPTLGHLNLIPRRFPRSPVPPFPRSLVPPVPSFPTVPSFPRSLVPPFPRSPVPRIGADSGGRFPPNWLEYPQFSFLLSRCVSTGASG
jgi:hypothetical protein